MSTQKLAGKVAVVTGASKGIGAAVARLLAEEGAAVTVNYSSSKEGALRVVEQIAGKEGCQAIAVRANVAKQADIQRLFAETKKAFGRLDVLVNNAGIYEMAPLVGSDAGAFSQDVRPECAGTPAYTQEACKHMGEGGSIVNVSSIVSTYGYPGGGGPSMPPPRRLSTPSRDRWPRSWPSQNPREFDQPRHDRDGRPACQRHLPVQQRGDGVGHAAGADRPAVGHRPGRRLFRVGRFGVGDGRDALHHGRAA